MKQKKKNTLQTILIILLILGLILTAVIAGILLFGTKSESRLRRQLSLGERYYNDLDYDRAIAAYDEALEIDPKNEEALYGIAYAYEDRGQERQEEADYEGSYEDYTEAKDYFEQAVTYYPDSDMAEEAREEILKIDERIVEVRERRPAEEPASDSGAAQDEGTAQSGTTAQNGDAPQDEDTAQNEEAVPVENGNGAELHFLPGLYTLVVSLDGGVAAIKDNGTVEFDGSLMPSGAGTYEEISSWEKVISIAFGNNYIIALKKNGTLEVSISSAGLDEDYGQCDVEDWKKISQVAAGLYHTVGLKSDGTVVAAGNNEYGQCDVDSWTDIVMIAAGDYHTVGLKSDGTVVATGRDTDYYYDQCAVGDWTDMIQITAGCNFTAGLCSDGTVKITHIEAQGYYPYGRPEKWTNVICLAAGGSSTHLLALLDDGSVVGIGPSDHGLGGEFIDAGEWEDMVMLACGRGISVGITRDGTVLMVGMMEKKTLGNLHDIRIQ